MYTAASIHPMLDWLHCSLVLIFALILLWYKDWHVILHSAGWERTAADFEYG
ncbi:hypothetical protein BJ508DRAFT_45735 [Ascobolus immersus RN42]|uniref:Uncharacterized protein n=1 Tax=Ascobolus immersus RN42 TaxID=1160509 RepID=A0A3N4IIC2_ASCIM|nr:hypothetical protein BJ508DRAFT_45735 [Ascobolus immersus RN42]